MKSEEGKNLEYNESSLWKAFKAGDEEAFARIYQWHIQALLNYGRKISNDQQLVQDSIQDLFVELWAGRQRLSDTSSIKFYLFRALRNKLSRGINPLINTEELSDQLSEPSFEFHLLENERTSDRVRRLTSAVAQLSKRQQEAINLRYFHDFSNEEVARMMGLNYQSACKLIYSGLKFLKENIKLLMIISLLIR